MASRSKSRSPRSAQVFTRSSQVAAGRMAPPFPYRDQAWSALGPPFRPGCREPRRRRKPGRPRPLRTTKPRECHLAFRQSSSSACVLTCRRSIAAALSIRTFVGRVPSQAERARPATTTATSAALPLRTRTRVSRRISLRSSVASSHTTLVGPRVAAYKQCTSLSGTH